MQSKFAGANAGFSFDLLREAFALAGHGSVQISPFSVRRALIMAALGARGQTRQAFLDTFHLPAGVDLSAVCQDNLNILDRLVAAESKSQSPTTLRVANALWVKKGNPLKRSYKALTERWFDATTRELVFNKAAVKAINDWVKLKTEKIDSIIDSIDPDARAFLTDALYLKTPAKERFLRRNDAEGTFFRADGSELDVTYMVHPHVELNYLNTGSAEVLQFPFGQRGVFNYYLLLPGKNSNVQSLLAKLNGPTWLEWKRNLALGAGRFAIAPNDQEFGTELSKPLSKMGLSVAFSDVADFQDMCDVELKIGAVKHKSKTTFTRRGFEGAAVTIVEMVTLGCAMGVFPQLVPFDVTVDRPYLWLVEGGDEILFAATTLEPKVPALFADEVDEDEERVTRPRRLIKLRERELALVA